MLTGVDILRVILVILWTSELNLCADDEHLNDITDLMNNNEVQCSEFFVTNNMSHPLYVHTKYPVLTRVFKDEILFKHYKDVIQNIELFITLFDNYISQINSDIPKTDTKKDIKRFLSSLTQTNFKIKTIGLCYKGQFIDSKTDVESHYLCKNGSRIFNSSKTVRLISNRNLNLYWEPVSCISSSNVIRFPLRLVYYDQDLRKTPILIFFEFDARQFRLNQCETGLHRCKDETTRCHYHYFPKSHVFATGNYYCKCRMGFYMSHIDGNSSGFPGHMMEKEFLNYSFSDPRESKYSNFNCFPCNRDCYECENSKSCTVTYSNPILRGLPLAIQSFCITICLVTGIIVFQLRRTRVVKSSNWILLELFLLGAISVYSMVINVYFKPTEITCAIQPFLREGGFVLMYGVLYVKVYRVLCSFQSRKAQRVYVRDQDILRYLGVLVIICLGHLIAWIATNFDHTKTPFLDLSLNLGHRRSCRSRFWDIVSYFYETGLLAITIYYCKCVKSAPSEYGEVRFITIAVVNEFFFSLGAIILRMSLSNTLHPDYLFLIYFIHCHVTTTISVGLLMGPKLWYLYRPPVLSAGRPRLVPHSETHIIQTQQKLNGDVDLVEINLAEMDSETIRDELKRLYTQLEIYKTRAMRKDNPHVSRKRGGRKQRRFSLQHFHKKHHTSSGHDDETSKISEDSGGNSGGEEVNLTSVSTK